MSFVVGYLVLIGVTLLPWIFILRQQMRSGEVMGLTLLYIGLSLVPILNIATGIAGWGILMYTLSCKLADKINNSKR